MRERGRREEGRREEGKRKARRRIPRFIVTLREGYIARVIQRMEIEGEREREEEEGREMRGGEEREIPGLLLPSARRSHHGSSEGKM